MPLAIGNPRKKKRKGRITKRKVTKRRKTRKRVVHRKRVVGKKSRKITKRKGGRTMKRRKKGRKKRRTLKSLPLFVTPKRRKRRKNPANPPRRRRKRRRNPVVFTPSRRLKRAVARSRGKKGKRRKRRRYIVGTSYTRIPIRRGKRRAYIKANPDVGSFIKEALWIGAGVVGNSVVSGLVSNFLGGTIPFLDTKLVPSALTSALAYAFLRKQNPTLVAGSFVNTTLEAAKVVLPEGIKEMLGFGEIVEVAPDFTPALPNAEQVAGFDPNAIQGFNPEDPDIGASEFPIQTDETFGDVVELDDEDF